jgi:hypothetical protein
MRRTVVSTFALLLLAAPALAGNAAEDRTKIACREYARAVADEWSAAELEHAEPGDPLGTKDKILVIAAGESYYIPRKNNTIILRSVGTRIRDHKTVYWEEYRRCLRHGGDITIHLDAAQSDD